MRQINRAIDFAIQGEYECAITLAGAAEGMLPETWKPYFYERIKEVPQLARIKEEGGATGPNDFKNWLKHSTLVRGGPRIDNATIPAEESVAMVYRAVTKFHAVYDDLSPQMIRFLNWMGDWLQKELGPV
jgi:hypothetical protein